MPIRKGSIWTGQSGFTTGFGSAKLADLCGTCQHTYGEHYNEDCDPAEQRTGRKFKAHTIWNLEMRKPSSPIPAYQHWSAEPGVSKMTTAVAQAEKQRRERENGKGGWEYRLVPYFPPAPPKRVPPIQTLNLRPGTSLRPALEEVDTDYLELLATEAKAEAARRALRSKEAEDSAKREKEALWMRVHGKAALQGWQNFMTGVTQAMASRAVLRWSKNHRPYGGSKASSGEDWSDDEIYAAEQLCYARGHVPPWHLDAAKASQVLQAKAGLISPKPRPVTPQQAFRAWDGQYGQWDAKPF